MERFSSTTLLCCILHFYPVNYAKAEIMSARFAEPSLSEDSEVKIPADKKYLIVQDEIVQSVYGDSIAKYLKRALGDSRFVFTLNLRDFHFDKYKSSKLEVEKRVAEKTGSFANLAVFGATIVDSKIAAINPEVVRFTPLLPNDDYKNELLSLLTIIVSSKGIGPHFYIIQDQTPLSSMRTSLISKYLLESYGPSSTTTYDVKTKQDLQSVLLKLNSERRGVIFNNTFHVFDADTNTRMRNKDTDREIAKWNTKHFEIGVVKNGLVLTAAIGYVPKDLATVIKTKQPNAATIKLQLNIERMQKFKLEEYVIDLAARLPIIED